MATRVFRVNPGEGDYSVTEAVGAATTKLVEVTVDCAVAGVGGTRVITRDEVLEALQEIENYIQKSPWPPV